MIGFFQCHLVVGIAMMCGCNAFSVKRTDISIDNELIEKVVSLLHEMDRFGLLPSVFEIELMETHMANYKGDCIEVISDERYY